MAASAEEHDGGELSSALDGDNDIRGPLKKKFLEKMNYHKENGFFLTLEKIK